MFRFGSKGAYWACLALFFVAAVLYYPKWKQSHSEATLSWDVFGYYAYLPAFLIYKDAKQLSWWPEIEQKYCPTPPGFAYQHSSGNWVMKYSMGQALQFLPWFWTAHILAKPLGYEADGFSLPYQAAISWGSLLVAALGLWFLRKSLLVFFADRIVALVLLCLVLGSNYLEYASITGAMTHNWLFALCALLIYCTIRFYEVPRYPLAAVIGLCVGWATLTRPTEILIALIPLLWGLYSKESFRQRLKLWRQHWPKALLAVGMAVSLICVQLVYWKYATGEWVVYSYQDQGFTWFPPHIGNVLWSARAGWLVYSPMMAFAVAGLFLLRRRLPKIFPTISVVCLLILYVTSAWDIWWYGGSLGQRALVQSYPLWAFGMASFWDWAVRHRGRSWLFGALAAVFCYLNLWWTHQAHRGGLFVPEQMTQAYVCRIIGRFKKDTDDLKLLDTPEDYRGKARRNPQLLFSEDFDADTTRATTADHPILGNRSLVLDTIRQFSPEFPIPLYYGQRGWLRCSCLFRCATRENEWWRMTQFVIRFKRGDQIVKERMIRLQRHVEGGETRYVCFDTQIPTERFDSATLLFWNAGSAYPV